MDLTKITTSFCSLDTETQKALKAHGGPYEVLSFDHGGWIGVTPDWNKYLTYRVKPAPWEPASEPIPPIKIKAWAVVDSDNVWGKDSWLYWEKSEAIEHAEKWGGTIVKLKGEMK